MKQKNTQQQKPSLFFINKDKEALFSKKNRVLLSDPMDDNNPITVQVFRSLFCSSYNGSTRTSSCNDLFGYRGYGCIECYHFIT